MVDNQIISWLLISDVSDHLPVFRVYESFHKDKKNIQQFFERVKTEDTINAFKEELIEQKCESVFNKENIDKAYRFFVCTFKLLYHKNLSS